MIVTVKPKVPIRGVTRNVILSEQTLDLNLFQIKKCIMFGTVTVGNTVLTAKNVDDVYAAKGVVATETKDEVKAIKEAEKAEEKSVKKSEKVEKEIEKVEEKELKEAEKAEEKELKEDEKAEEKVAKEEEKFEKKNWNNSKKK